jgi:hypothetical protein
MAKHTEKGSSPELAIHEADEPRAKGRGENGKAKPADPPPPAPIVVPAAVAGSLVFVRMLATRQFAELVTVPDASTLAIGANGLGLIVLNDGRMFSAIGPFAGDGNPAHDPLIGLPMYAPV